MGRPPERKKPSIVLIEDDYTTRLVVSSFLSDRGYEQKCLDSPPDTPDEIPPDAVLIVDARLKGVRAAGIQWVKRLPADKVNLPLIFISNWGTERVKDDLADLQRSRTKPYRWMDKPLELDLLESFIAEAVRA